MTKEDQTGGFMRFLTVIAFPSPTALEAPLKGYEESEFTLRCLM